MTQPKWFVHISPSRLSSVAFKAYRVNCLDNQAVVILREQMNIRLLQGCADSQNLTLRILSRLASNSFEREKSDYANEPTE